MESQLIQVDGTPGTCSTAAACYIYDATGRRVQKIIGSTKTNYLFDLSGHVVAEDNGTSWGPGYVYAGGQLIAEYKNSTTFFVHDNNIGTSTILSNLAGGISPGDCNALYPFGEQDNTICSTSNLTTRKFTGKERDSESGLDNFEARYYSSSLGRFMRPDDPDEDQGPEDPQSWNLFAYVRNNPLRNVDPTGKACVQNEGESGFHGDGGSGETCAEAVSPEHNNIASTEVRECYWCLSNFLHKPTREERGQFLDALQNGQIPSYQSPLPFGPPAGVVGGILGNAEEITFSFERLMHIVNLHSILRAGKNGKSAFAIGEDIVGLIKTAKSTPAVAQAGGQTFERVVDAGRVIGMTREGNPTTIYTVITNVKNDLVTAFPGTPK